MLSRIFRSRRRDEKKKGDKEVSLVVECPRDEQDFVARVSGNLLREHSPVFGKMAESGAFKKSRRVKLKGITPTGLQKMIEYITTDSVYFLTHYDAIETLKAAYMYQVLVVYEVCCNFLITVLDSDNVCDIYEFAVSYSFHRVEYHCLQFIDRRAGDVLKSSGFMTLKRATAEDILGRRSLDVESEATVFRAVLTWGFNDCMRRGVDSGSEEEVLRSARPLLKHVRFATMSEREMADPKISRFFKLLCTAEDSGTKSRRTSILRSESTTTSSSRSSSVSLDSLPCNVTSFARREHVPHYVHELETLGFDAHAVRSGETLCLSVELLKGRVFLTGLSLAFDRFVSSKGNSCLYVALSATNLKSEDQVTARGAFMTSEEEASLKFPSPLMARESETVEMVLSVRRAVNVCSMLLKDESQIALSGDRKEIAMKIVPFPATAAGGVARSMFKSIQYFY